MRWVIHSHEFDFHLKLQALSHPRGRSGVCVLGATQQYVTYWWHALQPVFMFTYTLFLLLSLAFFYMCLCSPSPFFFLPFLLKTFPTVALNFNYSTNKNSLQKENKIKGLLYTCLPDFWFLSSFRGEFLLSAAFVWKTYYLMTFGVLFSYILLYILCVYAEAKTSYYFE